MGHLFVCVAIEKMLEATDKSLTEAAEGLATSDEESIASYANEALRMAASFETGDTLPDAVLDALMAIREAASGAAMFEDIAPLLLENGLIIQEALPQTCPKSDYPDIARHES